MTADLTVQDVVRITVPGKASQQGSKRHVGNGRMVEMAKDLPRWRKAVIAAAQAATGPDWEPWDGALTVTLDIRFAKPKSTRFRNYPAGPPDVDKLQRAIGDALTHAGTIHDDARICAWHATKAWATEAVPPGAYITITRRPY